MGTAPAESPNFGDEQVIAACLELIEAGRPLSEILETAKTAKRQQVPCESERASDQQPFARTWRKRLRAQLLFWMILVAGGTSIVTVLSNQAPATVEAALPLASVPLPTAIAPSQGNVGASSPETTGVVEDGIALFGAGDVSGARNLYERAAATGDKRATLYLALTYDPLFLKQARLGKTIPGDSDKAAYWYGRAREISAGQHAGPAISSR